MGEPGINSSAHQGCSMPRELMTSCNTGPIRVTMGSNIRLKARTVDVSMFPLTSEDIYPSMRADRVYELSRIGGPE